METNEPHDFLVVDDHTHILKIFPYPRHPRKIGSEKKFLREPNKVLEIIKEIPGRKSRDVDIDIFELSCKEFRNFIPESSASMTKHDRKVGKIVDDVVEGEGSAGVPYLCALEQNRSRMKKRGAPSARNVHR